jgi:hypothetical protein
VKRVAAALAAAVLLVVAATGLSSIAPEDYCFSRGPAVSEEFDGTSSAPITWWPPGQQCRYETATGEVTTENLGSVGEFAIVLAGGVLAVFRRSRYTWSSLIVLAIAGLVSLNFGFQAAFMALILGGSVALVATRSVIAAVTAVGVFVVGSIPYFWNGSTLGWAVLLGIVSFADRILDAVDERLARWFSGPQAEF